MKPKDTRLPVMTREDARHIQEDRDLHYPVEKPKENPLKDLVVEVYAHNSTSQGTLTPSSVEAILKALGKT